MARKFWENPEFKLLEKEWEGRLAKEGLADIEKTIGNERALKQNASNFSRQMDVVRREAKETYFRLLSACLHRTCFENEVDQTVMSMRAQGASITEICRTFDNTKTSRWIIRLIIKKYEHLWGIRFWSPHQLKYNRLKKAPIR